MLVAQEPRKMETTPAERFRVALQYAIQGDLRFIAHHDELRMLARAVVRAHWPLRFSEGFNPQPRVVIPFPRMVGVSAADQLALIELRAADDPAELQANLSAALPGGARLLRVCGGIPQGTLQATRATYELSLETHEQALVAGNIPRLLQARALVIRREFGPDRPTRPVEIRAFIESVTLDGPMLRMHLHVERGSTARPTEVLAELGLPTAQSQHRLRRVAVRWDKDWLGA